MVENHIKKLELQRERKNERAEWRWKDKGESLLSMWKCVHSISLSLSFCFIKFLGFEKNEMKPFS